MVDEQNPEQPMEFFLNVNNIIDVSFVYKCTYERN